MSVEDLLVHLFCCNVKELEDFKVIKDISIQVRSGIGFTQKQANLAMMLIKKYRMELESTLSTSIINYIRNPYYDVPIRPPVAQFLKNMSVVDDHEYLKVVLVKFPYNEGLVSQINKSKTELSGCMWDKSRMSWVFVLNEENLCFLKNFADQNNFIIDEALNSYFKQIDQIQKDVEFLLPMLVMDQEGYVSLINLPEHAIGIPKTKDIIYAIFQSRKLGITVWCERIKQYINQLSPVLRDFIKTPVNKHFYIDAERYDIKNIMGIIENMMPCMVFTELTSQLDVLKRCHELFVEIGVNNSEMVVSFRLDGKNNQDFNDYVKINKLNSKITQKTKIVFVGEKLPKPLVKSDIKFNSVLCFENTNFSDKHSQSYLVKRYIRNLPNLIYYSGLPNQ